MENPIRPTLTTSNGHKRKMQEIEPPSWIQRLKSDHQQQGQTQSSIGPGWITAMRKDPVYMAMEPRDDFHNGHTPLQKSTSLSRSDISRALPLTKDSYLKELNTLEAKYEEDRKLLLQKRNANRANLRRKYLLLYKYDMSKGTELQLEFFCKWPNQFKLKDDGNAACTFIAIAVVARFLNKKVTPTDMGMQELLERGANVWRTWKKENPLEPEFQYAKGVYNTECLTILRKRIELAKEMAGNFCDEFVSEHRINEDVLIVAHLAELEDSLGYIPEDEGGEKESMANTIGEAVDELYSVKAHRYAAVIVCKGKSTCMMYNPEEGGVSWFFDSHGGREKDKSTLVKCKTKGALVEYLKHTYYVPVITKDDLHERNNFEVTFFKPKPKPKKQ